MNIYYSFRGSLLDHAFDPHPKVGRIIKVANRIVCSPVETLGTNLGNYYLAKHRFNAGKCATTLVFFIWWGVAVVQ